MGWLIWIIVIVVLVVLVLLLKPRDRGGAYPPYFAMLNQALKNARVGRARILIDQDRLDHNLTIIQGNIPSPDHYRIVVKSIPCVELLRYIKEKVVTNKFMVVHEPFLKVILDNFDPGIDILLGKPLPVFACEEFFKGIPASLSKRAQKEIQWLVDTDTRMQEYLDFATQKGLTLRVSVELDIGLHRGGVDSLAKLDAILKIVQSNSKQLVFSGYMGYDGHVASAPGIFTSARQAALAEFANNMAVYQQYIDHGRQAFPELFKDALTFNSGGSSTYSLFDRVPFITDIGIGGAVLRPSSYPALFLGDLLPAEYVATPMIKKWDGALIPFLEGLAGFLRWWNPNDQCSFGIYGGSWAGAIVAPPELHAQMLTSTDPANENLVTNQSILNGSRKVGWGMGDFAFYYPKQSDAMFQFEDILLIRNGKVIGTWNVFDIRY
jgi:D-serine deaminase-like pyridoxal phosphate-dependent protein